MLLIGTGDLASDMLIPLCEEIEKDKIVLFNEVEDVSGHYLAQYFKILTTREQAKHYLETVDNRFIVGIGNNLLREQVANEFIRLGGINPSFISKGTYIGCGTKIAARGVFIMQCNGISMSTVIEEGVIVYLNSGLGHNTHIKKYTLVSSQVTMSNVTIGDYSTLGIGANFKPGVRIGNHCIVGTGSVVTKSFGDNAIIYGVPATQKQEPYIRAVK